MASIKRTFTPVVIRLKTRQTFHSKHGRSIVISSLALPFWCHVAALLSLTHRDIKCTRLCACLLACLDLICVQFEGGIKYKVEMSTSTHGELTTHLEATLNKV